MRRYWQNICAVFMAKKLVFKSYRAVHKLLNLADWNKVL